MTGIDKNKVRSAFDRAAGSYDSIAAFQHHVCESLLQRIPSDCHATRILDAGCGTGYGATLLQRHWPDARIIGCDLAPEMVKKTQARGIPALCGDLEHLPFTEGHFDFAWSSLALQWCAPELTFAELHRVLAPGGMLACTTLTTGTLHELDTAFAGIDQHRRTLEYLSLEQTRHAFVAAGFQDIQLIQEKFITRHTDFTTLLKTIRGIGAGQSGHNRRRALMGKQAWHTVQSRFEAMRGSDGLLPATYEVLFVLAHKR